MTRRRLCQLRLGLESEDLWERLPAKVKEPCVGLLSELLRVVLTAERIEEKNDERQVDPFPS